MGKLNLSVVGLQHRASKSTQRLIARQIEEETEIEVMLIREPENAHDSNAIKVVMRDSPYKGLHIGYIARGVAEVLAAKLDSHSIQIKHVYIVSLDPDEATGKLEGTFKMSRKTA